MISPNRFLLGSVLSLLTLTLAAADGQKGYVAPSLETPDEPGSVPRWQKRMTFKQYAASAQRRVNDLKGRLSEWGSVTVSAPLIMKEIGQFNLGDDTAFPKTLDYINLALTTAQGGVSQSTQTAFSNQLDLTVTPTITVNPLTGEKAARTMPTNDNSLTPDTVTNPPPVLVSARVSGGGGATPGGAFAPPGSLIVNPNNTPNVLKPAAAGATGLPAPSSFMLSGAQAVGIGASTKLSERLIREMADPPQRLFTNPKYQIHFAIVQVSCNPGWRTRENYIADVSATCEYFVSENNMAHPHLRGKAVDEPGRAPRVFSVLPLIDAQTLELQNSERRMTELAASISAAYPTAAANLKGRDVMQFVKQFQKDTQTVTPKTVANSYSSGPTFGFRLMPSLTALKDPARSGSKPANILQATSFPVLVTVVVSVEDMVELHADSVRVNISNRWLVNDVPKIIEFWRCIGLPLWPERTAARVDLAIDFGEARQDVDTLLTNFPKDNVYREAALTLDRDLKELRNKILGVGNPVFPLPPPAEARAAKTGAIAASPVVQRVLPEEIVKRGSASLFISGLNFFTRTGQSFVFDEAHPDADPGIEVWLGQLKGKVLLCNGDDQLVVRFDDLDTIAESDAAALIIRSKRGAIGWGQAVRLKAPTGADKPTITTVKVVKLAPDASDNFKQLKVVASGVALGTAKGAKLKGDKALTEVLASIMVFSAGDGEVNTLLTFTTPPTGDQRGILELYKDAAATGDPFARADVVIPAKK